MTWVDYSARAVPADNHFEASFRVVSAYKFVPLTGLPALRQWLFARCAGTSLKGTILLSPEGINVFLSGTTADIDGLLAQLRALPGLADLEAKASEHPARPFKRLKVKLKKQIIAFDDEAIDPSTPGPMPNLRRTSAGALLNDRGPSPIRRSPSTAARAGRRSKRSAVA